MDKVTTIDKALALLLTLPDTYTPRLVRVIVPKGKLTYEWKAAIMNNDLSEQYEAYHENAVDAILEVWHLWENREQQS